MSSVFYNARVIAEAHEPGNSTRYELLTTFLSPDLSGSVWPNGAILVNWMNGPAGGQAGLFSPTGVLHSLSVQQRLGGSECDAAAIAVWIASIYPNREPAITCTCGRHGIKPLTPYVHP